ncbi:hypothetical protein PIB30_078986 [Stylosanthes scabra]|uniref:F-box domain-containing protein n=1 Tax=Stylosanthes scabra TaxID=79078 RepID=A0ABU6ZPQ1_9FABA|nr:hypothetical protein [Stylosanthes scabra]
MDMILNLPKNILHEILLRMPIEDAIRANILSKSWRETCSTFPVLVFFDEPEIKKKRIRDEQDLQEMVDIITERSKFLNRVDSTLESFYDQGLAIKHFGLVLNFSDPHIVSSLVDHWIELACLSGLEELFFAFGFDRPNPRICEWYRFPLISILESKSLVFLSLKGCIRLDKSLFITTMFSSSLRTLSLVKVFVEEAHVFHHLISCCPVIEYLTLDNCFGGLEYMRIHNLPKLKCFTFRGPQEVDVHGARSLELFQYIATGNNSTPYIDTTTSSTLKRLDFDCPSNNLVLTDMWFLELFHKFSCLERLQLTNCNLSRDMHLSSVQLRVLKIAWCRNLENAWINAPNLVSFSYQVTESSTSMANMSFDSCINPTCLEFNVVVDTFWSQHFTNIRKFLQNIEPKNLLESVVLTLTVKTLLWEMLIRDGVCYCDSFDTKCWWHGLKDVQVIRSSKDGNEVMNCTVLLFLLPLLLSEEEITFKLEA